MSVARTDFSTLRRKWTVAQALEAIRRQGTAGEILYFYVVDGPGHLLGVVPTRRLLTAPLEQSLEGVMIERVISVPHTATVLEACEYFLMYKFLALPVVDDERRIVGVVDVSMFAREMFDVAEREQMDEIFERIGFRIWQVREARALRAFRFRFPWLLTTIASGIVCALLASAFEVTLAKSIVLAFFLALVLGLGESVSIQSMTVAIQALRATQPTLRWYARALRRELKTALLLGGASGLLVGLVIWLWQGAAMEAGIIGASILLSLCAACLLGLTVPSLLHALRLDPKIAAGPVTLALADIFTLLFYFVLAWAFL